MSSTDQTVEPPLPQGAGYAVLLGFGFFFAGLMYYITRLLRFYNREDNSKVRLTIASAQSRTLTLTSLPAPLLPSSRHLQLQAARSELV